MARAYGYENVLGDYGAAPNSSWWPMVMDTLYCGPITKEDDLNQGVRRLAHRIMENGNVVMLAGHFPVTRYASWFGLDRHAVFVREPIQRMLSLVNYKEREFRIGVTDAQMRREAMIWYMEGVQPVEFGSIGVYEVMEASLALFKRTFKVDFPILMENMGRKGLGQSHFVPPGFETRLAAACPSDSKVYQAFVDGFRSILKGKL
jgi:hypothetical protein